MAEIKIYSNADELARAAAEWFVALATEAIAARGRFTVALSGGSTPRAMHLGLSSEALKAQVDWRRVHIFWGDERCVPPDHEHSNYRMAKETLLERAPIPAGNIHRIRGEADPEQAASEYEQDLRVAYFGNASHVPPRFDLIYLGMGDDGHTASIFPGTSAVREPTRWAVAQAHDFPPPPLVARIRLTPPVINAAAHVAFLVAGAGKAERLQQVLKGPHQPDKLPAQIIQPTSGKLVWMVEEAAAKNI